MEDPLIVKIEKTKDQKLVDLIKHIMSVASMGREQYKNAVVQTFNLVNKNNEFTSQEICEEMSNLGIDVDKVFGIHWKAQQHLSEIDPEYQILTPQ